MSAKTLVAACSCCLLVAAFGFGLLAGDDLAIRIATTITRTFVSLTTAIGGAIVAGVTSPYFGMVIVGLGAVAIPFAGPFAIAICGFGLLCITAATQLDYEAGLISNAWLAGSVLAPVGLGLMVGLVLYQRWARSCPNASTDTAAKGGDA